VLAVGTTALARENTAGAGESGSNRARVKLRDAKEVGDICIEGFGAVHVYLINMLELIPLRGNVDCLVAFGLSRECRIWVLLSTVTFVLACSAGLFAGPDQGVRDALLPSILVRCSRGLAP